jgi:hypothetical protein
MFEVIKFDFLKIQNTIKLLNISNKIKYTYNDELFISDLINIIFCKNTKIETNFIKIYQKKYNHFNDNVVRTFMKYDFSRIDGKKKLIELLIENIKKSKIEFVYDKKHFALLKVMDEKLIDNKYNGKYVMMIRYKDEYKLYNQISNFFIEKCNMNCQFMGSRKLSEIVLDFNYIKKTMQILYDYNYNITYDNIRNEITSKEKLCTYFPINVAYNFYKFFNAKSVLDISSGWGDRLMAACIADIEYYGADPNECNKIYYEQIIELFGNKNKQSVIATGFENLEIEKDKRYDLVFTSPPFFELEIYTDDLTQSHKKYNTSEKWINDFLYVVLKKAWKYLAPGGHMCLYIGDYHKLRLCENMVKYMIDENNDCVFEGLIGLITLNNKITDPDVIKELNSNPKTRPVWIFKKK